MWSWLASLAFATPVDAVPNPRPAGWIADVADVLGADDEARISARIDALHRDLDAEIAVVTVPSVEGTSPAEFGSTLLGAWGIGDARTDNGVVVLLVTDLRQLEIRSGDGLAQVLSQQWIAAAEEPLGAELASGDLAGAVEAAVAAVDSRLRDRPEEVRHGVDPVADDRDPMRSARVQEVATQQALETLRLTGVLGACILLGLGASAGAVVYIRRRERTCPNCKVFMPMLSEEDDDQHLTSGQVVEERIGSVDYQVHQCPKCGQTRTFVVHQFWTSYNPCPKCNNRTREIQRTTVEPATIEATGLDRVDERCVHCDYHASYTRPTPMLPPG